MDNSLFSKYQKVIKIDNDNKDELINLVEESSGIKLKKEEIVINKKKISLHISSAKKSRIHQVNIKQILFEKGYTLTY